MATEDVNLRMRLIDRAQVVEGVAQVRTGLSESALAAKRAGVDAAEGARGFGLLSKSMEGAALVATKSSGRLLRAGKDAGRWWGHGFREQATGILLGVGGFFAAEHLFEFGKDSIKEAAATQQAAIRAQMLFGKDSAETLDGFNKKAADSFGISEGAALKSEAQFALLGRASGLQGDQLASYSKKFTALSANLAAVGGTSTSQATAALQSGLRGRGTALKQYGVVLSTTALQAEALHQGILAPVKDQAKIESAQTTLLNDQKAYQDAVAKSGAGSLEAMTAHAHLSAATEALGKAIGGTVPKLTDQQKALAAQSLIMRQAKSDSGAFAHQSDLLVNKQARLTASIDNVKEKIGTALIPVEAKLVDFMLNKGVPALDTFSNWFGEKGVPAIGKLGHALKPLASSTFPLLKTVLGDVAGIVKKVEPAIKGIIDGFNAMPSWAQKVMVGGAGAAYVANKVGILGMGARALTSGIGGGIVASAKPIPVFVMNPGFGGIGGGLPGGTGVVAGTGVAGLDFAAAAANGSTWLTRAAKGLPVVDGGANLSSVLTGAGKLGLGTAATLGSLALLDQGNTAGSHEIPMPPPLPNPAAALAAATSRSAMLSGQLAQFIAHNGAPGVYQAKGIVDELIDHNHGLPAATDDAKKLGDTVRGIPDQIRTNYQLLGVAAAGAAIDGLSTKISNVAGAFATTLHNFGGLGGGGTTTTTTTTSSSSGASGGGHHTTTTTTGGPTTGGVQSRELVSHIHVNLNGRQVAEAIHSHDRQTRARR